MAQSSMSKPASTAPTSAAVDSLPEERRCARAKPRRVALLAPGVGIPPCAVAPPAVVGAVGATVPELVVPAGGAVCAGAPERAVADGVVVGAGVVVEVVLVFEFPRTRAEAGTGNNGAALA